jgi:hypothetical protein
VQRSTLYIDTPRRVLPGPRVALAATVAGLAIGGLWHLAGDEPTTPPATPTAAARGTAVQPPALGANRPATPAVGTQVPAAATAGTTPGPQATATPPRAPLSREVAPGVHVTPMSLPPGATAPQPAGPGAHDSEPEN